MAQSALPRAFCCCCHCPSLFALVIVTGCGVDVGVTANWFKLGPGILEDEAEFILLPVEMFKAEVEVWFKMAVSRASSALDRTGQEKLHHKLGLN